MRLAVGLAALAAACSGGDAVNVYATTAGASSSSGGTGGTGGGAGGGTAASASATTGAGGQGGAASASTSATTGQGGAGGIDPPECVVGADCPGVDNECRMRTCTGGVCGVDFVPAGTPAGPQTAGDCQTMTCDGAGTLGPSYTPADVEDDGQECTVDSCSMQGPVHAEITDGSPTCHARCVPVDPSWGGPHVTCSGVLVEDDGDMEFLGILWIDDMGTPDPNDDVKHRCGDLDKLAEVGATPAAGYVDTGTCAPGAECDVVRKVANPVPGSTEFVAGLCE